MELTLRASHILGIVVSPLRASHIPGIMVSPLSLHPEHNKKGTRSFDTWKYTFKMDITFLNSHSYSCVGL